MISMTTAAWVAFAVVAIVSTLLLKLTVRLIAKNADNGWDNAITYGIVTLLLAFPVGWMFKAGWFWAAFAPAFVWTAQTIALKFIYEIKTARAWAIGCVHTFLTSLITTGLALTVAVVAAYILYGKIISDPWFLIDLILRLIGIKA